ncbi:uncharacterized protein [Diadema antillarum]|uniref:uncharacterized protein n=1 Tax=Diadema antillarum TaxID=105358 RepID=UPI003A89B8D6
MKPAMSTDMTKEDTDTLGFYKGQGRLAALLPFPAFIALPVVLIWWIRNHQRKRRQRGVLTKVECWFCQASLWVPVGEKDSFDCLECEQYNGFTEDGGYNKSIPAQFCEELNSGRPRAQGAEEQEAAQTGSRFCSVCQTNQELKIQQLAAFVPSSEERFDVEVSEYANYLEDAYRLCPACDWDVRNELNRQDAEIMTKQLGQRLNQAVMRNVKGELPMNTSHTKYVLWLRILSMATATVIFINELKDVMPGEWNKGSSPLSVSELFANFGANSLNVALFGLVCCISSSLLAGKYKLTHWDCVCPLLWMVYMGAGPTLSSISPPQTSTSSSAVHLMLGSILAWMPSKALPSFLSAMLLLSSVKHAALYRRRKTRLAVTNRIKSLTKPPPRPRKEIKEEPVEIQEESAPIEIDSASPTQSLRAENQEIKHILLDQDIGGLSLGPPPMTKPRNRDVWTAHTPPTSRPTTPLFEERPSSRQFRPVISPATFNPSSLKRTVSQSSFASSFSGAFMTLLKPQEGQTLSSREPQAESGRGSSIQTFGDNSSDSSLPLGMSACKQENSLQSPVKAQKSPVQGWTSFLLPCLLGFSLGINFAVVIYLMYGR